MKNNVKYAYLTIKFLQLYIFGPNHRCRRRRRRSKTKKTPNTKTKMAPSRALTRLTLLRQASKSASAQSQPIRNNLQRSCKYHSYDHPPPTTGTFNPSERAILSAAYRHVPEHGFTQQALSLGARDAGYLDISTNLIPEGPFGLIRYHLVTQREALSSSSSSSAVSSSGDANANANAATTVPNRVERLTWERLLGNKDVNHRWQEVCALPISLYTSLSLALQDQIKLIPALFQKPQALAIMAQPSHVPASLHELALLADEIHFLAGDTSVDPTWYTKRAGLSMIYTSSELFMTNDRSPGFGDTRAFLQRRLAEGTSLSGAVSSVAQWVGFTASAGVNVLRSKGVRI